MAVQRPGKIGTVSHAHGTLLVGPQWDGLGQWLAGPTLSRQSIGNKGRCVGYAGVR